MNIDWMLLTYLIIGFFAIVGFFRGWWKEAVTMLVLAGLVMLLRRPEWAQTVIDVVNTIIATIWELVVRVFSVTPTQGPFQLDATSAGTWIMILILLLGSAALFSRLVLPGSNTRKKGKFYTVNPMGRILGVLLGALNGFLTLSLVREYLDGRALPGNAPSDASVAVAGTSSFGTASPTLSIQAVNLPSFTILDSFIPWLIIGVGLILLFAVLKSRVAIITSPTGQGKKLEYIPPYGYTSFAKRAPPPPNVQQPVKVEVTNIG
ncbi:MAG: hypothetical protein GY796_04145 [Chloroflexi bacterium]|nr:hypothetical protein [Chloroflexota bacterium]